MKVRYSRIALADLDAALDFLFSRDPAIAGRFQHRVQTIVARLGRHPESAQCVEQRSNVRRVPLLHFPYVVYYAVLENEVMILRIVHGARLPPSEFP
jgi:toxin ParE1/3/4